MNQTMCLPCVKLVSSLQSLGLSLQFAFERGRCQVRRQDMDESENMTVASGSLREGVVFAFLTSGKHRDRGRCCWYCAILLCSLEPGCLHKVIQEIKSIETSKEMLEPPWARALANPWAPVPAQFHMKVLEGFLSLVQQSNLSLQPYLFEVVCSWNPPACRRVWLEGVVPCCFVHGLSLFLGSLPATFCFVWLNPPSHPSPSRSSRSSSST